MRPVLLTLGGIWRHVGVTPCLEPVEGGDEEVAPAEASARSRGDALEPDSPVEGGVRETRAGLGNGVGKAEVVGVRGGGGHREGGRDERERAFHGLRSGKRSRSGIPSLFALSSLFFSFLIDI